MAITETDGHRISATKVQQVNPLQTKDCFFPKLVDLKSIDFKYGIQQI